MNRQLKIGRASYSVDDMRSMTEEEALKKYETHPVINPNDVKNAWKCCNGFSRPNHLKDQLKGIKPNRGAKRSNKKDNEKDNETSE